MPFHNSVRCTVETLQLYSDEHRTVNCTVLFTLYCTMNCTLCIELIISCTKYSGDVYELRRFFLLCSCYSLLNLTLLYILELSHIALIDNRNYFAFCILYLYHRILYYVIVCENKQV